MPISDEELSSYLDQKGYELSALKEEAKRLDFSQLDNIPAFIQQRISKVTEQIPPEIEYKPVILKYFRCALKAYNRGDDDAFRLDYLRADRNLENALFDSRVLGVENQISFNQEKRLRAIEDKQSPMYAAWQKMAVEIKEEMIRRNPYINKNRIASEVARRVAFRLREEKSEYSRGWQQIRKKINING